MYKQYHKSEFEYRLKGILIRKKAGFMKDITDTYPESWEHIYEISTKNKAVDIIIFSSVDTRTKKTREVGNDAVRIVLKWKTTKGIYYKSFGKRYRTDNLFQNLETSILDCLVQIFNLNIKEFTKDIREVS